MEKQENQDKIYRTHQIRIKKGHRMYNYFNMISHNANNLYNTTNFYIRQVYTSLTSDKPLHPLQKEVLDIIHKNIDRMNEGQLKTYQKKLQKEKLKPVEERKEIKANLFEVPTKDKPSIGYNFLDCLFKTIKQADYVSLPGQVNQQVMKNCFQNWKSFFASLKDYKKNPSKYQTRPNIPGYLPKGSVKEANFSNQICKIKEDKYLSFPLIKQRLNIGKLGLTLGKFQQVRLIPKYDEIIVEVIFLVGEKQEIEQKIDRCLSVDLGVSNLMTVVTNTEHAPLIFNGRFIKSINQYYNKQRAYFTAALRNGLKANEGSHHSKRLQKLHQKRFYQLKDLFHKMSFRLIKFALEQKIDTIVIGKNQGWKQSSKMSKKNNQNFVGIPYNLLIGMIQYKAEQYGITLLIQEESYTSKASFLDNDPIPTYQAGNQTKYVFSGKRCKRGLYKSKTGKLLNADVNGAANILRKVHPYAFAAKGIAAVCVQPLVVNVR